MSDPMTCPECGAPCALDGDALHRLEADRIAELERECDELRCAATDAFVQGAKWWEYEREGATMWGSDQKRAAEEAARRKLPFIDGATRYLAGRERLTPAARAVIEAAVEAVVARDGDRRWPPEFEHWSNLCEAVRRYREEQGRG